MKCGAYNLAKQKLGEINNADLFIIEFNDGRTLFVTRESIKMETKLITDLYERVK